MDNNKCNTPAEQGAGELGPKKQNCAQMGPDDGPRFLRLPAVIRYTQRSRSSILRDKTFPSSVRLSANTVAWEADAVRRWADERIAAAAEAAEAKKRAEGRRAERAGEFKGVARRGGEK